MARQGAAARVRRPLAVVLEEFLKPLAASLGHCARVQSSAWGASIGQDERYFSVSHVLGDLFELLPIAQNLLISIILDVRCETMAAFKAFQSGIRERCIEPPQPNNATIVGNYRMLNEG